MTVSFLKNYVLVLVVLKIFLGTSFAGSVGVYGVQEYDLELLSQYGIKTVFLPPQRDLIKSHASAGREVFLTLSAFGGCQAWKDFPDSVPVLANGTQLYDECGGICPTHPGWRVSRLALLAEWVRAFGGAGGISGVFLDFIRFPGKWEQPHPDISDSCWCDRCLAQFQLEKNVTFPTKLMSITEKVEWIKDKALLMWMEWKKEQITSFVRDVRMVLDINSAGRKLKLGVFLVPWRKSEFAGALSFRLAQDALLFAPYADVFSPMVYHRMVDKPVSWVGEITDYYAEMTGVEVWPIIQAEGIGENEFTQVIETISRSKAKRMLVYSFREITEVQWPLFKRFVPAENVLQTGILPIDGDLIDEDVLELNTGYSAPTSWSINLPSCEPGNSYLFSGEFLRLDRSDPLAYPVVSLWGREYLLNTHRMTKNYQKLKTIVTCPEGYGGKNRNFKFLNKYPGISFSMRKPDLVKIKLANPAPKEQPAASFFPIGAYGADSENLEEIKELGLNTAILSLNKENIETCLSLGMRCTFSVPQTVEQLFVALDSLEPLLQRGRFSYYVNDEPEIHSFPEGLAEDIQRILKERFPEASTNMAIVRPQVIPFYEKSADYFMMDQYPVPSMPMNWLSDSMDEAAQHVGRDRLQSVIQAFGGKDYAMSGWPRLPTFEEMNNLAFLSVIHGSRGIYFYSFPDITATEPGAKRF